MLAHSSPAGSHLFFTHGCKCQESAKSHFLPGVLCDIIQSYNWIKPVKPYNTLFVRYWTIGQSGKLRHPICEKLSYGHYHMHIPCQQTHY